MPIELRGDKKPRPQIGKTHKSTRLVRFVDLNDVIKDVNQELQELTEVQGGFIPLAGTVEGSPVTGDIEVGLDSGKGIVGKGVNENFGFIIRNAPFIEFVNSDEEVSYVVLDGEKFSVYSDVAGFRGFEGASDFTEVEIDNSLIYAQRAYVNRAVSYSTDETRTGGTWIDGKPIYRKCFELAGDGTTQSIVESLEGLDIENVTHISALGFRTSEYFVINGYQNGSDLTIAVSTDVGNGFDIQIVIQDIEVIDTNRTFTATLEYTKTID